MTHHAVSDPTGPDAPHHARVEGFPPPLYTPAAARAVEPCAWCGADTLLWRKCKQLCANCGQINRSCADL